MKIVLASSETERHFVKRTILGKKMFQFLFFLKKSYPFACIYLDLHHTTKHIDTSKDTATITSTNESQQNINNNCSGANNC